MALKQSELVLLMILTFLIVSGTTTAAARELVTKPKQDLSTRLQMNGDNVDCWSSLWELRSCSNEIVRFFMNGDAVIGPDCCRAISVITKNCWPAMLNSLGFTAEEGSILRGYCDAAASSSSPAFARLGGANAITN